MSTATALQSPSFRSTARPSPAPAALNRPTATVGISQPTTVVGSEWLTNEELAERFPAKNAEAISARTGMQRRHRAGQGQDVVTMAVAAAEDALDDYGLSIDDISMIICCTATPKCISPSTACLVLNALCSRRGVEAELPAFDISAACGGYLYALSIAHDYAHARPGARILVITSEVLSSIIDPADYNTATLFGDAATATIAYGQSLLDSAAALMHRPVLSAKADDGSGLTVPGPGSGRYVTMDGRKVFNEAVRRLIAVLDRACDETGISVSELTKIIPHQANGRILDAVRARLNGAADAIVQDVANRGNTSSSTVPLTLSHVLPTARAGDRVGICAFGAGFTFGAAILSVLPA